ncbi:unnamed protein product, partial [Allacma fusca]
AYTVIVSKRSLENFELSSSDLEKMIRVFSSYQFTDYKKCIQDVRSFSMGALILGAIYTLIFVLVGCRRYYLVFYFEETKRVGNSLYGLNLSCIPTGLHLKTQMWAQKLSAHPPTIESLGMFTVNKRLLGNIVRNETCLGKCQQYHCIACLPESYLEPETFASGFEVW